MAFSFAREVAGPLVEGCAAMETRGPNPSSRRPGSAGRLRPSAAQSSSECRSIAKRPRYRLCPHPWTLGKGLSCRTGLVGRLQVSDFLVPIVQHRARSFGPAPGGGNRVPDRLGSLPVPLPSVFSRGSTPLWAAGNDCCEESDTARRGRTKRLNSILADAVPAITLDIQGVEPLDIIHSIEPTSYLLAVA